MVEYWGYFEEGAELKMWEPKRDLTRVIPAYLQLSFKGKRSGARRPTAGLLSNWEAPVRGPTTLHAVPSYRTVWGRVTGKSTPASKWTELRVQVLQQGFIDRKKRDLWFIDRYIRSSPKSLASKESRACIFICPLLIN
ncbi:hypothetical protein TWF970_009973 [Orbilia oligospora]|uniref:Uncharacterized protein n=1 Tax=Orbilia oligospora TaxID=2813651 RepID=A0A7C8R5H2_ORBOL|nr:hypothetical protein TWF970_009973 [Orbilia oligospora]